MKKYNAISRRLNAFVVWPLYLFCIFQKAVNVLFEVIFERLCIVVFRYFFPIRIRFVTHRHILKIGLPAFLFVFIVISNPSFVEALQQEKGKMSFEFMHSNFDSRIFLFQDMNNVHGIFGRPFGWRWIKTFEFGVDSVSKFSGGNEIFSALISEQSQNTQGQTSNNPNRGNRKRWKQILEIFVHCFLFVFIGMFLIPGILIFLDQRFNNVVHNFLYRDIRTFWRRR